MARTVHPSHDELEKYLNWLTPNQAVVWSGVRLLGLTKAEVARQRDVSQETVYETVNRAEERLIKVYRQEEDSE